MTDFAIRKLFLGDNFARVTAEGLKPIIYRGAQPDSDRLKFLNKKYGINVNLNLRNDLKDEERIEVEAASMRFVNIKLWDDRAPDPQNVEDALALLHNPASILGPRFDQTYVIFVNCKGGKHRTGLIIACYRVRFEGMSKADAWKEAESYGFYSLFGHGPIKDWFFHEFVI